MCTKKIKKYLWNERIEVVKYCLYIEVFRLFFRVKIKCLLCMVIVSVSCAKVKTSDTVGGARVFRVD